MTNRFGKGDRHLRSFPPEQPSSNPDLGDEQTFRAREYFVDLLEEEAPDLIVDFLQRVKPTFQEVFDHAWPDPPRLDNAAEAALKSLLKGRDLDWEWPPENPIWSPHSGDSPFAEAFGGWPPPTPSEMEERPLDSDFLQELMHWRHCWALLGWLLAGLLGDELESWSEAWNLEENRWVASHLLARTCKARLLGVEKAQLDHVVFGSPGVLARFTDSLAEGFGSFRDWDPTQEQWGDWRKAAMVQFKRVLKRYKKLVLEKADGPEFRLASTRTKKESARDFRRLIRFQVLLKTSKDLLEEGDEVEQDVKNVQASIRRTAVLVGLPLRTSPSDSA